MTNQYKQQLKEQFKIALTWCLAWGSEREPQHPKSTLEKMRDVISENGEIPQELQHLISQVEKLQEDIAETPRTIQDLKAQYSDIWNQQTPIGLVYGGVTKVKQYVFESEKLMEIRGASAILDRINLVDLPAFLGDKQNVKDLDNYHSPRNWLNDQYPNLLDALIPELIIYSTGGNILAFCPASYVDDLADAIEKRYTTETLTANSCAVGDTFRLLEIRFGLLNDDLDSTPWFDWYQQHRENELVEAYFGKGSDDETKQLEQFFNRKSFNELAGKLAVCFNQRRSGNKLGNRLPRCYPPMLETHPYLVRDNNDRASAVATTTELPSEPKFSEPLARKYRMGQISKNDQSNNTWFDNLGIVWNPGYIDSWVTKFQSYLEEIITEENLQREREELKQKYYNKFSQNTKRKGIEQSRSLEEIANASNGFLSFIYADGNNMGGYIQTIKTPEQYRQFSQDIFEATEKSVYYALAKNLHPHPLKDLRKPDAQNRNGIWVHPFEIITIGGDDVLIIVPANQALAIAQDIGKKFEEILAATGRYPLPDEQPCNLPETHRYRHSKAEPSQSYLSTSMGVLITRYDTPIYYAENLTNQLLKSAKKKAKKLKKEVNYYGGTVDILTLKSVTMVSSKIEEFRQEGLVIEGKPKLKLYATPYTLHEVGGLIETIRALKEVEFPRSQLYQIRSLLEQGKRTAMLNYHYFRARLKSDKAIRLQQDFEQAWCLPKEEGNYGTLAPWMSIVEPQETIYETIWREIVDLYPFVELASEQRTTPQNSQEVTS